MTPPSARPRSGHDRHGSAIPVKRVLVPSSALLWGLQSAFLSPVLALILTELYGATTAEVGWVLAATNASGFVAALVLPAWADRKHNYLVLMMASAILTALLATQGSRARFPMTSMCWWSVTGSNGRRSTRRPTGRRPAWVFR